MQVHAYRDKAAYRPDLIGKIDVFLDGVNVTSKCVFADDVAGVVEVFVLDKWGKKMVDRFRDETLRKKLWGRVEIQRRPGAVLPINWREPQQ